MFEALEGLDWPDCSRQFTRVEEQIRALTSDTARRAQVYQLLFDHGGRCDCTVAFNIVKKPEVRAEVESRIQSLLNEPAATPA